MAINYCPAQPFFYFVPHLQTSIWDEVITEESHISISVLTGLYCFFCTDFLDQRKKSAVAKRVMAAPMV